MNEKETIQRSKYLSLILRHQPELIGLELDAAGWTDVEDLLRRINASGKSFTREQLEHVVQTSPKRRFAFSDDGSRIRANQGHSIEVDLQYDATVPPATLYHGTATRFLNSIRQQGLLKMKRHHVHLSAETVVTMQVGSRHGKPTLLTIDAKAMHSEGHTFYVTTNRVWLVDHVPVRFIQFPNP